jgi:hypothetical protein
MQITLIFTAPIHGQTIMPLFSVPVSAIVSACLLSSDFWPLSPGLLLAP